jgi:hypothetical protein
MIPRFPLYIPSKGRWDIRLTSDALTRCKVPHTLVVEEPELELYRRATAGNPFASVLMLDERYKDTYELCDDLGRTKSTGPGPARNFIWEHSMSLGYAWHWVMDDNIRDFWRLHQNRKIRVRGGAIFAAMEDFCTRYTNVYMAGPNYTMFVPRKKRKPPITLNTRIYSCNLIRNDIPFRWRGRYNEDTDLSLCILKAGACTVQFNTFLQEKITTQYIKGGNTAEFYAKEGTLPKSQMLVQLHPDVARLAWRFGREHHYVDYSPFAKNKLKRRADYRPEQTACGMKLVKTD